MDRATFLVAHGEWRQAHETLASLGVLDPNGIRTINLSATTALMLGRYREAREWALRSANLSIVDPEQLLHAIRLLRHFEEPEQVLKLIQHGSWHSISNQPMLAELALHVASSGHNEQALQIADQMLAIGGDRPDSLYLRGLFEMFLGRRESSLFALQRAVAIEPRMANAHWLIAMQGDQRNADEHITQMQRALPGLRPGSEAQAYMYYSLHSRLDSVGRYSEAWQALESGAAVMRAGVPYRRDEQRRLFDALKKLELPDYGPAPKSDDEPGLIFIVGMFRSGTTLIERILAGHPDVADGGETYQLSACLREATDHDGRDVIDDSIISRSKHADFDRVRQRMFAYAKWRSEGRKWLTEKLPSNFLNLGFILHAFPDARILHLRRDPVDTCFSNLRTIFRGAATYACNQADMADYYVRYADLMEHWHRQAPGRILDIDYANFIADPEGQARRMMDYCGLEYLPDALDIGRLDGQTATASAAHVRLGILKNRTGAWRPYEGGLQPLMRGLEALGTRA